MDMQATWTGLPGTLLTEALISHDPLLVASARRSLSTATTSPMIDRLLQGAQAFLDGAFHLSEMLCQPLIEHEDPVLACHAWRIVASARIRRLTAGFGAAGVKLPAEPAGDLGPEAQALRLNLTALHLIGEHRFPEAVAACEQALAAVGPDPAPALEATVRVQLAVATALQGQVDMAREILEDVLQRCQQHRCLAPVPVLLGLAVTASLVGDFVEAGRWATEALNLASHAGLRYDAALALRELAVNALHQGDLEPAEGWVDQGWQLATELRHETLRWHFTLLRSEIARRRADAQGARRFYHEAVAASGFQPGSPDHFACHAAATALALDDGDADKARRQLAPLITNLRRLSSPVWLANALALSAWVATATDDAGSAEQVRREIGDLVPPTVAQDLERRVLGCPMQPLRPPEAAAERPDLVARLFGAFQLATGAGTDIVDDRHSVRYRTLLAVLLVHPQGLPADQLRRIIYHREHHSPKALQSVVHRLRSQFAAVMGDAGKDAIVVVDGRYRLSPDFTIQCDWQTAEAAFRRLEDAATPKERLTAAQAFLQIGGQAPLASIPDTPWKRQLQDTHNERWRTALEVAVGELMAQNNEPEARRLLRMSQRHLTDDQHLQALARRHQLV